MTSTTRVGRDLTLGVAMNRGLAKTHFINVDLEIRGAQDLTKLAKAFEPHALALSCMPFEDGYLANLELATQPSEAEAGLRSFLRLIDALPAHARESWNAATRRDFSIGIEARSNSPSFEIALPADLLARVAEVEARITFVVYGESELDRQYRLLRSSRALEDAMTPMFFESKLSARLRAAAYRSANGEPAWNRRDACDVIGRLADVGLLLLGVDIWLATDPGPTAPLYQWEAGEQNPGESPSDYAKRVADNGLRYVKSFAFEPDDAFDGEPYFNLTYAERPRFACPCCEHLTLSSEGGGSYEICPVCFWEDDGVQLADPTYEGGANRLSLNQARANFRAIGASDPKELDSVRAPLPEEIPSLSQPKTP